jgi:sulfonate transport system substrate-binding protein
VISSGSAAAVQSLNANAIQIGSTAGAAALVARANGTPINTIGVFSQPEWSALVARDSAITSVADLKGRKIAAQQGTDPYFFLLQTLRASGLNARKDVEIVNLAHADGKAALERGDVAAWAGLDPLMAATTAEGSRIIYQNRDFLSYGVVNAREDFLASSPDITAVVLRAYERARAWIIANPEAAVELLAKESKLDVSVARTVLLERTNVAISLVPGDAQLAVLKAILPTLVQDNVVRQERADEALTTLFVTRFASEVLAEAK